MVPPGGLYDRRMSTFVLPSGFSWNWMTPALSTVDPGTLCQAMRRCGSNSVSSASHSTVTPAGPATVQWE